MTVPVMPNIAANVNKAARATYTVYWTEAGISEPEFLANRRSVHSVDYNQLGEALACAHRVNRTGGTAWLIAGSDGSRLTKSQIEKRGRKF